VIQAGRYEKRVSVHPEDFGAAEGERVLRLLENSRKKLGDYQRELDRLHPGQFNELAGEAFKRIQQVERLLGKIVTLMKTMASHPKNPHTLGEDPTEETIQAWSTWFARPEHREIALAESAIGDDIELYTESVYWFAGKARSLLRKLPLLEHFEPVGVRNVRNKLLEHSDRPDSMVLMLSFAWGGKMGPIVKGMRLDHQRDVWPDDGLFPNLEEFAVQLSRKLDQASGE
jgi:hypothetical protein